MKRLLILSLLTLACLSARAQTTGCVMFAWAPSTAEPYIEGYKLYHSTNSFPLAEYTVIATAPPGTTNAQVFVPFTGSHYFFLTAYRGADESNPSNVLACGEGTTNLPPLTPPLGLGINFFKTNSP